MPRPLGSPNVRSKTVGQICEDLGFSPLKELIELRNKKFKSLDKTGNLVEYGISPELYAKICTDLLHFIYPRLTATQVSGIEGGPVSITVTYSDKGATKGVPDSG